jgi:hypothetical protein
MWDVETYKLVFLQLVATVAFVGVQRQEMPLFKPVQPIEDMSEKSLSTPVTHILDGQVVASDECEEGGKEECREVVSCGSHEDFSGACESESTCCLNSS